MPALEALTSATMAALETMCFTSVLEPAGPEAAAQIATAYRLKFSGEINGQFALGVSESSTFTIAANFLGLDPSELSKTEANDVICELTNMVAGSLISGLERHARFDLSHPEPDLTTDTIAKFRSPEAQLFTLEDGIIAVWLER